MVLAELRRECASYTSEKAKNNPRPLPAYYRYGNRGFLEVCRRPPDPFHFGTGGIPRMGGGIRNIQSNCICGYGGISDPDCRYPRGTF